MEMSRKKKKKETSTTAVGCLHYATLQLMSIVLPFLSADGLSRTGILTVLIKFKTVIFKQYVSRRFHEV